MNKRLLSSFILALLLSTSCTRVYAWWDRESKIGPLISAGLAAVGIIGLANWLFSESDYDVINQAQSDLHTMQQRYNHVRYAYEQTAYDRYAQEQELKRMIKQQHGHEDFYLISYYDRLGTHHNLVCSQINKVKERLRNVETAMGKLSRHDEKFDIANRARIELNDILHDLEQTAHFLGNLHQRIGTWQEFAQQKKKHRKHLAKLEQERRERERERKLREQQWELDRMNQRVRELEREKRAAYERSSCNCTYENCIHVHFN